MEHDPVSDAVLNDGARHLLDAHPHVDVDPAHIAALLKTCAHRTLAAGEQLCSEGDPSDALWFLLEGRIRVEKRDLHGNLRQIGSLDAPTVFGQMGIIDRARRSAACTAEHTAMIAIMDRATFRVQVRSLDDLGNALRRLLLSGLTHQMTQGNARLRSLLGSPTGSATALPLGDDILHASGVLEGWASAGGTGD